MSLCPQAAPIPLVPGPMVPPPHDTLPVTATPNDRAFRFRPVTRGDASRLHEWLSRPHVAEWWTPTPTLDEVTREIDEYLRPGSLVNPYIVLLRERPIGYIQSYIAMGSGDGWWP